MLALLRQKKYRVVFGANFVSLFGSGLNHSGIIWYVLQQTHSEKSVALLISLITLPSLFLLPFTGLLIDRVDRRYLSMTMDVCRGIVVALVAFSFFAGYHALWLIYAMGTLLGVGAMVFWPNLYALIQELVTPAETVGVNALVMGASQTGWMIAGTLVGFLYDHIGVAGILAIDASTYFASTSLMYRLRQGKNLAYQKKHAAAKHFSHELAAGVRYILGSRPVLILGVSAALFQAAMLSQNVLTAPLNDKILHTGAFGYGMCAAGWSLGAIVASGIAGTVFRKRGRAMQTLWLALLITGLGCVFLPLSGVLAVAVALYFLMGGGRGFGGVGVASAFVEEVPAEVMGRTQNAVTFAAVVMQLIMTGGTGWLAERVGLFAGFLLVGGGYLAGSALSWFIRNHRPTEVAAGDNVEPLALAAE